LKFVKIGGLQQLHVMVNNKKTTMKTALILSFQSYFDTFTRQHT